ncbi:cytochrome c-type biogenesis protein CcmH [Ectothiorhodospira magna]|uniref:Cytochrome c-type biogenesis protein n=1 Tax=Ectothiorhodospira magna TaxID=867345 RepID=A0A1H9CLK5_9GAMM|nr:cytochrome c-type biogenesis protein [Ectothiorhodospira magna]SEQ01927.1 cytochrome c-type biogenesis protein CcmH [Ectothiorhodospira magna]
MKSLTSLLTLVILGLSLAGPTLAGGVDPTDFDDPVLEQRYRAMLHELRCTVCQNQSLADSDAGLARDLRRELRDQLRAGATDEQIIDYMVARYGQFVLYRPPLSAATFLLWTGPFILLLIGLVALYLTARKSRQRDEQPMADADARERARRLLNEGNDS